MEHFSPYEWLMINVAIQYGHKIDKKDYQTRLLWTLENMNQLESMDAEDPATYQAAVLALRDTQNGIPTGGLVGLDSSSSGFQLTAVLTRCEVGMRNTGVLNTGKCPDFYTTLTDAMDRYEYDRKVVKYSAMPWLYSSKRAPQEAFEDDLPLFLEKVAETAPHAVSARNILINSWNGFAEAHEWYLPDGFHVYKEVRQTVDHKLTIPMLDNRSFTFRHKIKKGKEQAGTNCADVIQSVDGYVVREMHRRCNYDVNLLTEIKDLIEWYCEPEEITDRTQCISLVEAHKINISNIHEYDPQILMRVLELINVVLENPSFDLITIHDEFRCHANHVETMRMHHNRILWDMYHSDLLMDIVYQLTGKQFNNWDFDQEIADQILLNDYSIN